MSLLIIRQDGKTPQWMAAFTTLSPEIEVVDYHTKHNSAKVQMALLWKHPPGVLQNYPNLKGVASMGAGVDFIFQDPSCPLNIPITRVVDPALVTDMEEFITAQIYAHLKQLFVYKNLEAQGTWAQMPYLKKSQVIVGIMGLGVLGGATAKALAQQGFRVQGWAASKKEIPGVKTFESQELNSFLKTTQILVCLLPLTQETKGILCAKLFQQLPKGAFLIHVARGAHLVEKDLVQALDKNRLSGAAIDVFHQEPLPEKHPFWAHPKVHITPHIASISSPKSVVPQIAANYRALLAGQPLFNQVNRDLGY